MHLDNVDRSILRALQANSRLSLRKLAQIVHMTAPAIAERVHRLEAQKIIVGYTIKIDHSKLEPRLEAYIHVFLEKKTNIDGRFLRFAAESDEVLECYRTVGDSCYLMKVAVTDHTHLDAFSTSLLAYGNYRVHLVIAEPIKSISESDLLP